MAIDADIIQKSGSWYAYNGNKIGQGKENVKAYLQANPEILAEIDAKVREKMNTTEPKVEFGEE